LEIISVVEQHDDLAQILQTFDRSERFRVAAFLRKPASRTMALAVTPLERVHAVNNWLNAHGLPPTRSEPVIPNRRTAHTVALPTPTALPAMTLQHVLEERRSHYSYSTEPLPLVLLADLLHHALRIFPRVKHGADVALCLSPAPSAGGLNPVTVHVAVRNVDGLEGGVYSYDRVRHVLTGIGADDPTRALRTVYGQTEFIDRAPTTLLLTAALRNPVTQYGPRHYRTLHLDTGVVAQNLYLVATALGLGGCAVAGYRDAAVRQLLRCDEDDIAMMLFAVGEPRLPS
jgi:SagB-type dehydrogenase family enzyme